MWVVYVVYGVGVYMNGLLYAYFVPYIVEAEATEWVLGLYIVTGVLSVPAWVSAARRFEKMHLLAAAMVAQTACLFLLFFAVGSGDLAFYAVRRETRDKSGERAERVLCILCGFCLMT